MAAYHHAHNIIIYIRKSHFLLGYGFFYLPYDYFNLANSTASLAPTLALL